MVDNTIIQASRLIQHELMELARNVPEGSRSWFFDGRNRDIWMDAFIDRLKARYQQPDRIASND